MFLFFKKSKNYDKKTIVVTYSDREEKFFYIKIDMAPNYCIAPFPNAYI